MKKTALLIAAVLIVLGLMTSCDNNTVKIGVIIPENNGLGKSIKSGLKLAEEEINKESRIKYQLVFGDAPAERDVITAYNLIKYKDDIKIFVTTGSSYSMALKPTAIDNGEWLFCVASLPDITADGTYNIYKIGNSSVDESNAIVNYLTNDSTANNIVLFYPNTEYGIPFYETINKQIVSCTSYVYNDESLQNYNGIISKVIDSNPNVIVAIGNSSSLGVLVKKIRTLGYDGTIVSNAGFTNSDVITSVGDAANGVVYLDYDMDNSTKTEERNDYTQTNYQVAFSSFGFLAYSIPYLIDAGLSDVFKEGSVTNDSINASVLEKASALIRSNDKIQIAGEYPYNVYANGDIKPSLKFRIYGQ